MIFMFTSMKNALKRLGQNDISRMVKDIVWEHREVLIGYSKEHLDDGFDAEGSDLGDYSPYTIEIKKAKGQPYDRINLKDTGKFRNEFYIDISTDEFEIDTTDPKKDEVLENFSGFKVMGVSDEFMQKFVDTVLYRELNKKINAKFGIV